MKLSEKEKQFLLDFANNFECHSLWSQNDIIKHYKITKSFIYTLLKKLNMFKWKEFLMSFNKATQLNNEQETTINDKKIIEMFIKSIEKTRLYIVGQGYSKISGYELLYFIDKFKTNSSLIDIKKEWTWKFMDEKMANSVFIVYSSKGVNTNIVKFLEYVYKLDNVKIYCVTENHDNIYSKYVDGFIYCEQGQEIVKNIQCKLSPIIPQININFEIKKEFLKAYYS